MPIVHVTTNQTLDKDAKAQAVAVFSALAAKLTGKSEDFVQAILLDGQAVTFGGSADPAVYAVFQSVGLPVADCPAWSAALCKAFQERLGVDPSRAYIMFEDLERAKVGWGGRTLG